MKHRDNLDDIAVHAVHDPVAALDDLAEGLVTNFGYHASRQRMALESGDRGDNSLHDKVSVRGESRAT